MPRGGYRPGAGRRKGSVNRVTAAEREANAAAGETPLQYMLRIMRDGSADQKRRDAMAIAAAPYQHPRLTQIDGSLRHTHQRAEMLTDDELADIAATGGAGTSAPPVDPGQLN